MTDDMATLSRRVDRFVERRSWGRFHTPKNLSMAIAVEAAELMEPFQWHDNQAPGAVKEDPALVEAVEEELADIMIYCLSLATRLDIDLLEAVAETLDENERRFDEDATATFVEDLEGWVDGVDEE
ncbi:MAG: nucleotide pyrophosphohydrolase [Halobacteriales archaeon]|nr:nucleotide pyrophosphohydrolase [Halobacteriales archaeon]